MRSLTPKGWAGRAVLWGIGADFFALKLTEKAVKWVSMEPRKTLATTQSS